MRKREIHENLTNAGMLYRDLLWTPLTLLDFLVSGRCLVNCIFIFLKLGTGPELKKPAWGNFNGVQILYFTHLRTLTYRYLSIFNIKGVDAKMMAQKFEESKELEIQNLRHAVSKKVPWMKCTFLFHVITFPRALAKSSSLGSTDHIKCNEAEIVLVLKLNKK